ncbi:MAG: hypothetical protein KGO96_12655 [Elusimicrobia bacterium]|nr:hypothetical protein [Elusimicrobiota bacterium]
MPTKKQPATTNRDLFMAYMRGWHCGAGIRPLDPKFTEHPNERIKEEYLNGWAVGRMVARDAAREAERLYGYSQSIIRLCDLAEGSE